MGLELKIPPLGDRFHMTRPINPLDPIKKVRIETDTGKIHVPKPRSISVVTLQPEEKQPNISVGTAVAEYQRTKVKIIKNSKRAQVMLERLGFDPITHLVKQYQRLEEDIAELDSLRTDGPRYNADGIIVRKFSAMAYSTLLALQQKLLVELLPYGYAKQPGIDEGDAHKEIPRLSIILTPKGGNQAAMETQTYNAENDNGSTYEQSSDE